MQKNNKKRLLILLEYLIKETNDEKRVTCNEIISHLEERGINNTNRKTIYDDIKNLNEMGYDIEYDDKGYYLLEAPFSLAEIKIIIDSLNSLRNLDLNLLNNLNKKLLNFISYDEELFINKLSYTSIHKNKKLLQRLELILSAIKNNNAIKIKRKNNKEEIVFPLFLNRNNDYYYLYCHYENIDRLYHYRLDNIIDVIILDIKDNLSISKTKIIENIEASSNGFLKGTVEVVNLKIINNNDYLIEKIMDDFPSSIKTKDGFSIKTNINKIFFAKILEYGTDIKIMNKDVYLKYIEYLKTIINIYRPEK